MTPTHARVLALGLALLPGCSPDPAAHEDAPPGVPLSQIEHQRAENQRLERLLTLAASNQFYLLLEPERGRLRLIYEGADLRDWAVIEAAVGRRRVLFSDRSLPGDWWESVWQDGELEPAREVDRAVIDPPDGGPLDSVAVVIPEETLQPIKLSGRTLDVSAGGMKIRLSSLARQTYHKLLMDRRFARVEFVMPEAKGWLRLTGKVVWIDYHQADPAQASGECFVGISFGESSPGDDIGKYTAFLEDVQSRVEPDSDGA